LILAKASVMRISIPLDLSSRSFIGLPRFIHSRRPTTHLRVLLAFLALHSFSVTFFTLGFRLF
jgi:hypothetical protein